MIRAMEAVKSGKMGTNRAARKFDVPPVGSWLVNVSVSEPINIHRAGRCSRSGGRFKRSDLCCVARPLSRSVLL